MCSSEEEEEETQSSLNPSFLRVRECGKIAHSLCVSRSPSRKCGKQGEGRWKMQNPPLQTRDRNSFSCFMILMIMVQDYRSPQFIDSDLQCHCIQSRRRYLGNFWIFKFQPPSQIWQISRGVLPMYRHHSNDKFTPWNPQSPFKWRSPHF